MIPHPGDRAIAWATLAALTIYAARYTWRHYQNWCNNVTETHTTLALDDAATDRLIAAIRDVDTDDLDTNPDWSLFPDDTTTYIDGRTPIAETVDFKMWAAEMGETA